MIKCDKVVGFIGNNEYFHSSVENICILHRDNCVHIRGIFPLIFVDSNEIPKRMAKFLVDFRKKNLIR